MSATIRTSSVRAALLVLVLTAGCTAPVDPDDAAPPTSSISPTQTVGPPIVPSSPLPVENVTPSAVLAADFSQCRGLGTHADFPGDLGPGEPPKGWQGHGGIGSSLEYNLYTCDRLRWGPFERGPISVIFEAHSNGTYPDACDIRPRHWAGILHAIWITDGEIATWLNATYGLKTYHAEIEDVSKNETGLGYHTVWNFGLPGQEKSRLEGRDLGLLEPIWTRYIGEFAWSSTNRWYVMNFTAMELLSDSSLERAVGELRYPTLWNETDLGENYTGVSLPSFAAYVTITIRQYGDWKCEQPIS